MSESTMKEALTFKSFLSHRYKSPEVNLYFFEIFNEVAEVQFEVDEGTFSTNVTRLERMVRDADAFIGLYPFPGSEDEAGKNEELRKQSRYFRLELDLAIRSQIPAIVYYDKRYGDLLKPPPGVFSFSYDFNEIAGTGGYPSYSKHKKLFTDFCEFVKRKRSQDEFRINHEKNCIGIIISSADEHNNHEFYQRYTEDVKSVLREHNFTDIQVINPPFTLDNTFFKVLERLDFAIILFTDQVILSGLPAYLHGRFIPSIRLQRKPETQETPMTAFLYGGVEVGYLKDTVYAENLDSLLEGLSQKLKLIKAKVNRINTYKEAAKYFSSAALRKEAVFLSYSGKDVDIAREISTALKKHFQKVFDYRDGESIRPGKRWLEEIFDQLSNSAIGINLLSHDYLKSGNCTHELREMVARTDEGKLELFPIKLYGEPVELPPFFRDIQYIRRTESDSVDDMVKKIVEDVSRKSS